MRCKGEIILELRKGEIIMRRPGKGGIKQVTDSLLKSSGKQGTEIPSTEKQHVAAPKPWSSLFKDNRDPRHGIKLKYVPPKGETLDLGDRVLPSDCNYNRLWLCNSHWIESRE
ncbi:unnamed protein product [Cuscuta europaea]|uniref:Uncharacterized protein n=1 Tax=Cuscuta europaea TaxID=41803 RepID=A0A9P0Z7V2_CUSEU|nr:unnamed protein product [Cuscuta europaea]